MIRSPLPSIQPSSRPKGESPLGLEDGWIDSKGVDETPVLKKKRLSLSLKKRSNLESDSAHLPCATSEKENAPRSRWSFLSEVEKLGLAKKCLTKNTATMTKCALTNFQQEKNNPTNLFRGVYDMRTAERCMIRYI